MKQKLQSDVSAVLKEISESEWADYWGAVQTVSDRDGREIKLPGRPWHFSQNELENLGAPAFQGEHNAEVMGELGIGLEEINELLKAGVLLETPPASRKK